MGHKEEAESLLSEARTVYGKLRQVPPQGITRFVDGHTEVGNVSRFEDNAVYHLSQSDRRDELGAQIDGLLAQALVHATLYQGEQTESLARVQSLKH